MMGIPVDRLRQDLHLDQHHPRRRRPRVRRHATTTLDGARRWRCSPTPRRSARTAARNPQDDITSVMMAAEVDGEQLTPQEFGSFFILLVVAGNETTRNAISHGMKALTEHPDQREAAVRRLRDALARPRSRRSSAGPRPSSTSAARPPRTPSIGGQPIKAGREGRDVLQLGQPRRAGLRATRTPSTSPARCNRRRSASAPAARTSASAPTSPAARSR